MRGHQQQRRQQRQNRQSRPNENTHLIGTEVSVIQKHDQPTGRLTPGTVAEILTNAAFHPRGVKVRLTDGTVGRISSGLPGGATIMATPNNYHDDNDNTRTPSRPTPSLADFMAFPSLPAAAVSHHQNSSSQSQTNAPPPSPPPASEWACPACTFVNSGLLPACELCQTAR